MDQSNKPKFKLVVESRDPIHFHSGTDAGRAYQQLDKSLTAMIMIRSKKRNGKITWEGPDTFRQYSTKRHYSK